MPTQTTDGMRQRGTLRPLNKLTLPQSPAWIVPLGWLHLYIGIFTCNYMLKGYSAEPSYHLLEEVWTINPDITIPCIQVSIAGLPRPEGLHICQPYRFTYGALVQGK